MMTRALNKIMLNNFNCIDAQDELAPLIQISVDEIIQDEIISNEIDSDYRALTIASQITKIAQSQILAELNKRNTSIAECAAYLHTTKTSGLIDDYEEMFFRITDAILLGSNI